MYRGAIAGIGQAREHQAEPVRLWGNSGRWQYGTTYSGYCRCRSTTPAAPQTAMVEGPSTAPATGGSPACPPWPARAKVEADWRDPAHRCHRRWGLRAHSSVGATHAIGPSPRFGRGCPPQRLQVLPSCITAEEDAAKEGGVRARASTAKPLTRPNVGGQGSRVRSTTRKREVQSDSLSSRARLKHRGPCQPPEPAGHRTPAGPPRGFSRERHCRRRGPSPANGPVLGAPKGRQSIAWGVSPRNRTEQAHTQPRRGDRRGGVVGPHRQPQA